MKKLLASVLLTTTALAAPAVLAQTAQPTQPAQQQTQPAQQQTQQAQPGRATQQAQTGQQGQASELQVSELMNMQVVTTQGQPVGEVMGVVRGQDQTNYLLIQMAQTQQQFIVPTERVSVQGNQVMLTASGNRIDGAQQFNAQQQSQYQQVGEQETIAFAAGGQMQTGQQAQTTQPRQPAGQQAQTTQQREQAGQQAQIRQETRTTEQRTATEQAQQRQATGQQQVAQAPDGARIRVDQAPPEVTVRQDQPQIIVRQAPPTITVMQPQPEIIVRMPEPQVDVRQAQAQVQVEQSQPQVQVDQADQARVAIQQGQPQVSFERTGEPQVQFQEAQGQPQIRFERMEGGQAQAQQGQPQQGQQAQMQQGQRVQQGQQAQTQPQGNDRFAVARQRFLIGEPADTTASVGTMQQRQMNVADIEGMEIYNARGEELGEADRVLRDPQGQQHFIVLTHGGFLGIGENEVVIPVERVRMRNNQLIVEGITEADLEQMEDADRYASFTQVQGNEAVPVGAYQ